MQLEGLLSRFALRELLELSIASLVNGAIEVDAPSGTHRIFFHHGDLVHVSSPDASGFEALWPLFELSDAPFRFVAGLRAREHTITEPGLQVVAQAEAEAQQWRSIRPHIPRLDIVPELIMLTDGEQVRIYEEDWPVLSCVDGTRTIAEVARVSMLAPVEVCTALLRLKERGLVQLMQQRTAGSRFAPVVPDDPPPVPAITPIAPPVSASRPTFFAKLLTGVPEAAMIEVEPAIPVPVPHMPTETDDILRLLRS
jgi:hypothetical protein